MNIISLFSFISNRILTKYVNAQTSLLNKLIKCHHGHVSVLDFCYNFLFHIYVKKRKRKRKTPPLVLRSLEKFGEFRKIKIIIAQLTLL